MPGDFRTGSNCSSCSDLKPIDGLPLLLDEENLPRNSYYGNGSPIELETLELIRSTYESTKIKFAWQQNDLLLSTICFLPMEEKLHGWAKDTGWHGEPKPLMPS